MAELNPNAPAELVGFDKDLNPIIEDGTIQESSADKVADPALVAETSTDEQPVTESSESFMPEGDVTPGLESHYKSMQGAFTRKMQELSEKDKSASEVGEKAKALDQLMANPGFRRILAEVRDGRLDLETVATTGLPQNKPQSEESDEVPVDPDLQAYVDKRLESVNSGLRAELEKERAAREATEFTSTHSDWKKFETGMSAAWAKNRHLSMEEAYRLSKFDAVDSERTSLAQKLTELQGSKRASMATEPGTVIRGEPVVKHAKDYHEAAQMALAELRAKGTRFDV